MKVLVLGGTGWLGHNIALTFNDAGYDVTVCSRGKKKIFAENISHIRSIKANKKDHKQLEKIFRKENYDIVIDSVPEENSIAGIHKYARGLKHYIHCSSTGGYTPLPFIPCDESAPYTGFPYGEGYGGGWDNNAAYDTAVMNFFNIDGFPATVIRPCYITGPGMRPLDNIGSRRPDFISDIINNVTLDLPDNGLALLQPIHVKDLARSFLLAAENSRKSIGQIYNICLEKAVTLNKYLEINASAFNTEVTINHIPMEKMLEKYKNKINPVFLLFFGNHMCFDISKAKEQLAYIPKYSTEEAIKETALWAAEIVN